MSTSKKKLDEQPITLRRSSRSTRGSIKPVIDLTKSEQLSDNDDEDKKDDRVRNQSKNTKVTPKEEEEDNDDEVQVLNLSDNDSDQDFEETGREIKASAKDNRQSVATKKSFANKSDPKTPRRGQRAVSDPSSNKSSAKQAKGSRAAKPIASKKSQEEQEHEEPEETTNIELVDVCYELSEKEMKDINNAFDQNSSNDSEELLGSDNLKTAIRSLGFEPRTDEIQKLIKKFANKKGKINRDGFHKIMAFKLGSSPGVQENNSNDEISRVFNLLDLDKTGQITIDNLKSISKELNEEITDEELREMIEEADLDGDFQINKMEFHNIMKKTSLY